MSIEDKARLFDLDSKRLSPAGLTSAERSEYSVLVLAYRAAKAHASATAPASF